MPNSSLPLLYQQDPPYRRPSIYPSKGWTNSIYGYLKEARQWSQCIIENRRLLKRSYTWVVHINHCDVLPPHEIKSIWDKAKRKLHAHGIDCLWVREVNKHNKVHYHLIFCSDISERALKRAVDDSMPQRTECNWRKRVEPIKNEWRLAHYVTKAKISGKTKQGKQVADLYRDKRMLFIPGLPLRKIGTIGDFWGKPRKEIWQDIRNREQGIAGGLELPGVELLAGHVHQLIGGYYPLERVRRWYGYHAETPEVQLWVMELFGEELGTHHSAGSFAIHDLSAELWGPLSTEPGCEDVAEMEN